MKPKRRAWRPSKADHIAFCYYILALCGAISPVLSAVEAPPVWYSVVAAVATMAAFRLRRLETGAQTEALLTPPPRPPAIEPPAPSIPRRVEDETL